MSGYNQTRRHSEYGSRSIGAKPGTRRRSRSRSPMGQRRPSGDPGRRAGNAHDSQYGLPTLVDRYRTSEPASTYQQHASTTWDYMGAGYDPLQPRYGGSYNSYGASSDWGTGYVVVVGSHSAGFRGLCSYVSLCPDFISGGCDSL